MTAKLMLKMAMNMTEVSTKMAIEHDDDDDDDDHDDEQ